jgi:Ribbon-helix-helix protein, copG family
MARTQTMVQLSDDLVRRLDEEAQQRSVSRSALIRNVLTQFLNTESEAAKVARWVEGYRRIPPPTIDEWGNLEEQAVRGTHEMMRELDAEDEAAGFSW